MLKFTNDEAKYIIQYLHLTGKDKSAYAEVWDNGVIIKTSVSDISIYQIALILGLINWGSNG